MHQTGAKLIGGAEYLPGVDRGAPLTGNDHVHQVLTELRLGFVVGKGVKGLESRGEFGEIWFEKRLALLVACDVSLGRELFEIKIRVGGVRFMKDEGLVEPETARAEDVFEHEELVPISATAAAALVRSSQDVNNEASHERSTVVDFLTKDIGNLYKLSRIGCAS